MIGLLFDTDDAKRIVKKFFPNINDIPNRNYSKIICNNRWEVINFDENNSKLLTSDFFIRIFSRIPEENIIILPLSPQSVFISADEIIMEKYLNNNHEILINEINLKTLYNQFSNNIYYIDPQQREWIEKQFHKIECNTV